MEEAGPGEEEEDTEKQDSHRLTDRRPAERIREGQTVMASRQPLIASLMMMMMMMTTKMSSAGSQQNFCSNSTVMKTRVACHSCTIGMFMRCPSGFTQTPKSVSQDCKYHIRTASMKLAVSGCSFECYQEVELKTCCPGYWGPDCIECPEEAANPCSKRGRCSDGMGGNGTCSCQEGFAGTACEDCATGRYGPTCGSVCPCVHGLCDAGVKGSGSCICFSGYRGPYCDQELPDCAALRCEQNSRCMEEALTGRMVCQCLPGHAKVGDQCLSINPCELQVCHQQATCIHSGPNQHLCVCNRGYSGDGRVCMTIDPCQSDQGGCSPESSRCVYDGPGRSHCECLPGFELLSSGACSLKELCRPDSCHKNANCTTQGTGQIECTCLQGYIGNGKVCHGNIIQRLIELNTEPGGQWVGQLSNAITLFGALSWPLQNLGPFTIFVPINKGFRGISVRTLAANVSRAKYLCKMHLVAEEMPDSTLTKTGAFFTLTGRSGETDTSDGSTQTKFRLHGSKKKATIVQSNLLASNGIIHIVNRLIDDVLPMVESNTEENLMRIISDHGKFEKFKSLLEKANMASVLDLPGPITVFATIDSAFAMMPNGQLDYLSSAEGRSKLVELLRNHIVQSTALEIYNAVSSPRIVTMANQVLTFQVTENGQILVNGVQVVEAAIEAKNGRLYFMDDVLIPNSIKPVLPNKCDITETKIIQDQCGSCSKSKLSSCRSGVNTGTSHFGCVYKLSIGKSGLNIPAKGCAPECNVTVKTSACCKGFYGPDCNACPGGYLTPCSGHGKCSEGIAGNGLCVCDVNFVGSRCQYCSSSSKYGKNCDMTCPCVQGVCDNRPDSDGRCKMDSCQAGFTGRFCDRRTAACGVQAQFCHAHADCDFGEGTTRCVCKTGYQGDGITCVESDPCAPPLRGGCSLNAKCIKTGAASHICECLSGWVQDGDGCQPANNCNGPDQGGCHPNATCIYVGPGQSDCACKPGYKGDGRDCEAVNQCVTENGGCHYLGSCHRLNERWTCVCDDGYVGDGHLCYGTVRQELMTLPEISEFSTWTTNSGLFSTLSDQILTLLVPSTAAVAKMSAEDRSFWTMTGNLPSLIRNHVVSGNYPLSSLSSMSSVISLLKTSLPVSETDELIFVGGATITTPNVAATNGIIHIIDKVLVPDRKLSEGLLPILALRPDFSLFRSYLIEYNLTDAIEQTEEFTVFAPTDAAVTDYLKKTGATALDVNTTRYHVVPSERLLKTDLQPGGYKRTLLGFSYQLWIYPRDGKLFVNDAQINSSNLLSGKGVVHGLSAVLDINKNRCDVITRSSVSGNCVHCLFPESPICPNGSKPDMSVKTRRCMFTWMSENGRRLAIGCRGVCYREKINSKCCGGFFGQHCEPCPGPKGQPCFGMGRCLDGTNGTGVCHCDNGFNGTACEECQGGRYGVHCDQECGCKNGRCSEGLKGDGTCECDVGWRGIFCDEKIESRSDELCGSEKCHTSANCVTVASGFRCLCAAGFKGSGTFCKAVDPCETDNGGCSPFAVCKRTRPGRRDCVCDRGFSGDGLVCVGINPCLEGNSGCHENAECIHVGPNKTSCACSDGFSGNGQTCTVIDLCRKNNGGCNLFAKCQMMSPGVRSCACIINYVGDGITCRGTVAKEIMRSKLKDFYLSLTLAEISLKGRGPFTVFIPTTHAFLKEENGQRNLIGRQTLIASVLRSHIVMGHTLTPADLSQPRNLTTLSGFVLSTRSNQGNIFINEANVTFSDGLSINGIYHEIDRALRTHEKGEKNPATPLNLTDVVDRHGYKSFYKLLEDTGVMDEVNDESYLPLTIFLPSDGVMASLPKEQKDFLFHKHNQAKLVEYLKYHVLVSQKVYAEGLIHHDTARTLQGSSLSFISGGMDEIGEIFVNDRKCRIVQRNLLFRRGIAYGIDCLLTPPSFGGRCDHQTNYDLTMRCGLCSSEATKCPAGSTEKEVQKCDLPAMLVTKNSGCRSACTVNFWSPKCCHGYHGRDCLACPGGAGSPCNNRGKCDDGQLGNGTCACDTGFGGGTCEQCSDGFFGPTCKACNCSENGSCDAGRRGTGLCFCEPGWTGERCETQQAEIYKCSPPCSPKAVCRENNTCVCRLFYEGDGWTCTVAQMCQIWNGGCAPMAKCSQKGETVGCTCSKGYSGDGFTCQPIDPCVSGENGGCHEHATCTMMGPGKRRCACNDNYIGDGKTCEVKQLPISRCLQDNGRCHQDAKCTDLHFEDVKLGVFHHRSDKGQYKLNYTEAQRACNEKGATLATYNQLSYAQQGGMNMCSVGWLDNSRVGYPTAYSNPLCGFGHVGIVDYGTRKNLSESWDTFCYRMKDVQCECKPGYVGDGFSCTGNLLQVLQSTPTFSNFFTQILNYSQVSDSGKNFVKRLSNLTVQSTLFVPDNDGLPDNQTLSQHDMEFHLSEGQALPISQLKNGSRIRTRAGSLTVLGVVDLLDPTALASRYINNRFVTKSDILASNGIIHVLHGPLKAPPPHHVMHVAHKAGMGTGVVLLIVLVFGVGFVGYHFYTHKTKPFQFHYFKEDDGEEEEEVPPVPFDRNINNPLYEAAPESAEPDKPDVTVEDKHQVADAGSNDLLQIS